MYTASVKYIRNSKNSVSEATEFIPPRVTFCKNDPLLDSLQLFPISTGNAQHPPPLAPGSCSLFFQPVMSTAHIVTKIHTVIYPVNIFSRSCLQILKGVNGT